MISRETYNTIRKQWSVYQRSLDNKKMTEIYTLGNVKLSKFF